MAREKEQNQVDELGPYHSASLKLVIYYRLTKGDKPELFEPLELFKQLDDLYSYTTANNQGSSSV
jgi:hypothetical protein